MPNATDQGQRAIAITPVTGPIDRTVQVPGSKSLTARGLCLAALASGTSTLRNPLFSDDIHYFAGALQALGIEVQGDPAAGTLRVQGAGGEIPAPQAELFVGLSGTAARFLTAVLALGRGCYTVDGVPRMRERPMDELLTALADQGARLSFAGERGRIPFTVCGSGLAGGALRVSGVRSSQPLSALLMVAPFARAATTLQVANGLVHAPFVAMTVALMRRFGVEVVTAGSRFQVAAGQRYRAREIAIEPDVSSASYFFAAAAVTGGRVVVPGLRRDSLQGDVGFLEVLERMGCTVARGEDAVTVQGPRQLAGVDVDLTTMGDVAPTLAAIAPFAAGPVTIRGIAHTRLQETDRVHAMATELRRLGVPVAEGAGSLRITPATPRGAAVSTYGDHRIAMGFAVTGLRTPGITIRNPGCTTKTFPDFFERFATLQS